MPYNGHPDEVLYYACLNDLERLRTDAAAFVLAGDMNPTGDNLLAFSSFNALNGLRYDTGIEWTYIEPRALLLLTGPGWTMFWLKVKALSKFYVVTLSKTPLLKAVTCHW